MTEAWRSWIERFDRSAATYDDETRDPWLAYEAAWSFVERTLRTALGELGGKRIADVGCGTGEYLRRLVGCGALGIGVEPSAGMRAEARAKVPTAPVLDGHLAAIPVEDGSVDGLIATYVVSHLSPAEQPAALDEILRVVAGIGPIVVVDVPAASPADMPRVREVLQAAGRESQVAWYEQGNGLALDLWRGRLEASGRRVAVEPLGPLLIGLAGLPAPEADGPVQR